MRPQDFDINKFVEDLQGTCQTLNDTLPEGMTDMDLTKEDHEYIDNEIFLCDQCGWWFEVCEATENDDYSGWCESCTPDPDEEEDEDE